MANVTDMSRDQAKNFLRTLGEEAHPSWTALEIKFRIGEITETELDRNLGIGSLLRKRPASSESTREVGPEETLVGLRKDKEVMSRATFQARAGTRTGKVNIYVLDAPNTPILLSIEAPDGLGAIIDFTTKTAVRQKIEPRIVIKKVIRRASWERSKKEAGTVRVLRMMEHNTKG